MMTRQPHDSAPEGVRHPPHLLWAAGLVAGAVALVLLASLLIDTAQPYAFDRALLLAFRLPGDLAEPVGPVWLHHAMRDITALGGGTVLTLVATAAVAMLTAARKWLTAALAAAAIVSGSTMAGWLKDVVDRPRPDIVPHLVEVSSLSFPSGHAANSATVYLTLATLLTQIVAGRAERNCLFAIAVLLVGTIGISRVYLGVHWPSDVLAGWSFGTLWAIAWWQAGKWARVRQDVSATMPVDE